MVTKERLVAISEAISEHLSRHDKSRADVQSCISEACRVLTQKVQDAETRAYMKLENLFTSEDLRLQSLLNEVNLAIHNTEHEAPMPDREKTLAELVTRADAALSVEQSYAFNTKPVVDALGFTEVVAFQTNTDVLLRAPENVRIKKTELGACSSEDKQAETEVNVTFEGLNAAEIGVLKAKNLIGCVNYRVSLVDSEGKVAFEQVSPEGSLEDTTKSVFVKLGEQLRACADYTVRVRSEYANRQRASVSDWGTSPDRIHVPEFAEICGWKACPENVTDTKKYAVSGPFNRIATKIGDDSDYCTIIGSVALPAGKVTTWNIKVVNFKPNKYGRCIYYGVSRHTINQNESSSNVYYGGWNFRINDSVLYSGLPHRYLDKKYGPRRKGGDYVKKGDTVVVSFDATNGNLSFIIKGENFGNAYEGIPLDVPLVPSCLLFYKNDTLELSF